MLGHAHGGQQGELSTLHETSYTNVTMHPFFGDCHAFQQEFTNHLMPFDQNFVLVHASLFTSAATLRKMHGISKWYFAYWMQQDRVAADQNALCMSPLLACPCWNFVSMPLSTPVHASFLSKTICF